MQEWLANIMEAISWKTSKPGFHTIECFAGGDKALGLKGMFYCGALIFRYGEIHIPHENSLREIAKGDKTLIEHCSCFTGLLRQVHRTHFNNFGLTSRGFFSSAGGDTFYGSPVD